MGNFWGSSILLLFALAAISPHCVVSFQLYRREVFFHSTVTAQFTSAKQLSPFIAASPILLKAASADEKGDNDPVASDHSYDYDLAIIGGGPVGVQAAIVAAGRAKKRVVLIDAPRASGKLMNEETNEDLSIGGPTGLFSKALRDAAKRIKVPTLRGMGLREDSIWNEITSACVELASYSARDAKRQLEYVGVTLIDGYAKFEDSGGSHRLTVSHDDGTAATTTTTISADKVLIATGSRPFRPAHIPFDGVRVFESDSINGLNYLPKSVVITGSGIVAIEFAKIFSNLGCDDVTLLIRDDSPRRALMKIGLDRDIAATLVADLIRSGITIERGCEVGTIEVPSSSASAANNFAAPLTISLKARGGAHDRPQNFVQELKADAYIAAVGRLANTNRLNLEAAGVEVDEYGGILIDSCLKAKGPADGNVYGAGDVLGRPFLASTGVAQGVATVNNMFPSLPCLDDGIPDDASTSSGSPCIEKNNDGEPFGIEDDLLNNAAKCDPTTLAANPFAFPVGVWSSPEAAYYGLSMTQAKEMGIDAGEGVALYAECLRGLVFSPNGLLKLVFQKSTGRVVGVHICGEDACELIHYGMELVKTRRTIADVANCMYTAVTYHEMYRIAAQSCMDPKRARKSRAEAGKALAKRRRNSRNN